MNRKGNVGEVSKGLLTLIGVVIMFGVLGVTLLLFGDLQGDYEAGQSPLTFTRVNNETGALTHVLNTTKRFNLTNTIVDNSSSIILSNGSGATVSSADYVISFYADGKAEINLTAAARNGNQIGANYTYITGSNNMVVNVSRDNQQATKTFSSQSNNVLTITILIVLITILMLGVLAYFGAGLRGG